MPYGYTHKPLKAYVYVCKTGNLAMVNSMKLFISTTTGVYTRPLVKCLGHQIRIRNVLSI